MQAIIVFEISISNLYMVANPPAPKFKTIPFTTNTKVIFCQTMRLVCLPILITIGIFEGISS
jgi:hypothetical protein